MYKFDVIIPVGKKDVSFLPKVIDYVCRCFDDMDHIYILTAVANFKKIERGISLWKDICTLVDEDKLLFGLSLNEIDVLLKKYSPARKQRAGWYFQQFLKLAFAQSAYSKDYYLSWDADTLPLAPIKYFEGEHLLFNPKNEYNANYFQTIEHLFGYGRQVEYSFIAENMIFSQKIVCEMLSEIENTNLEGNTWMEKILYACDFNNPMPAFSEFETYGTYCYVNYPKLYKPRYLNTFREAGYISGRMISEDKLRVMSFDLDTASFEMGHIPMFPYNIPHFIARLKRISQMTIDEIVKKTWNKLTRQKNIEREVLNNQLYRLPKRNQKGE